MNTRQDGHVDAPNLEPTFYADLEAMRRSGHRPLGGVVCTDYWQVAQQASRMQLQALYFRRADKWTDYVLNALRDLDVLLHLKGDRVLEAVAAVGRGAPRSLRLYSNGILTVIHGGNFAAAETMEWIISRAQIAARAKVVA